MVRTASSDGAWGGKVSHCVRVEGMFCVGVPVNICFDCSEDTKFVLFDEMAGVGPFAPIFVSINSSSVLKADAESVFEF